MNKKEFFLRIGTNAEKKYLSKLGVLFDSIIVRANYLESAPGMLSSMFLQLYKESEHNTGYIIDPVTYVFGLDPDDRWSIRTWQKVSRDKAQGKLCQDLRINPEQIQHRWIKECDNMQDRQKDKVQICSINRSYRKIGDSFFSNPLSDKIGLRAITSKDLNNYQLLSEFVSRVVDYQENAVKQVYSNEKYKDFQGEIPGPKYLLSPYFYIKNQEDIKFIFQIWKIFVNIVPDSSRRAGVLFLSTKMLNEYQKEIIKESKELHLKNLFLWLNDFKENEAGENDLETYMKFVQDADRQNIRVISMYSGGFSMLLLSKGLSGISTGPGYGMYKEIEPVQGGVPSAKFYIPDLYARYPVGKAYDMMNERNLIPDTMAFMNNICKCPICREMGSLGSNVASFISFYGEWKTQMKNQKKTVSTGAALERCAFHFLLVRLQEFQKYKTIIPAQVEKILDNIIKKWGHRYSSHIQIWKNVLGKVLQSEQPRG